MEAPTLLLTFVCPNPLHNLPKAVQLMRLCCAEQPDLGTSLGKDGQINTTHRRRGGTSEGARWPNG